MRKICVVTGSRAEYGILSRLMKMIKDDSMTQLQIIATNMHLMSEYGNTYKEIESDGFTIDKKVPMPIKSNGALGIVESMGSELAGMAEAFNELKPDLIVILGDRYEMLMVASAALIFRIPVAHLHGGEITEGAFDDSIRHAVTKLSHLHFTSTDEYRKRVIQLGENPERVFLVGALGVENMRKVQLMSKSEVETSLNFTFDKNTILATYHPITLSTKSVESEIDAFLSALDEKSDLRIIFTMPNSDTGGNVIVEKIRSFVEQHKNRSVAFTSLGMKRYLSVIPHVAAVIGNSSSGLIEVPSFGVPTLNIGDRQNGRISCNSVINCGSDKDSICKGLENVLSKEFQDQAKRTKNPYEKANTAEHIFDIIKNYPLDNILQKRFYDIEP